jgi:hypothetical protein
MVLGRFHLRIKGQQTFWPNILRMVDEVVRLAPSDRKLILGFVGRESRIRAWHPVGVGFGDSTPDPFDAPTGCLSMSPKGQPKMFDKTKAEIGSLISEPVKQATIIACVALAVALVAVIFAAAHHGA